MSEAIENSLHSIKRFVLPFIYFLFFLTVLACPFVFDYFPPGKLLRPPLIILILLVLAATSALFVWLLRRFHPKPKPQVPRRRFGKKDFMRLLVFLVLIAAISIATIAGYTHISNIIDRRDIESARQHFAAEVFGSIPEKQVESTLLELERAISSLRTKYGVVVPEQKRKLYLFPNVRTLQEATGKSNDVLGFVAFEKGQPVVYLPVEPVRDPLSGEKGKRNCGYQ